MFMMMVVLSINNNVAAEMQCLSLCLCLFEDFIVKLCDVKLVNLDFCVAAVLYF